MGKYIVGMVSVPNYNSENILDLPFSITDCIALKETFINNLGINEEDIKILGNEDKQIISRTKILKLVKNVSRRAEIDDTIIFYFSGHGISENNKGYLATYDTDLDLASDTSIGISRIKEELEKSEARKKMLIIDSCYSGIGHGKQVSNPMSEDFENSLFLDITEGWVIFASCKHDELSYPLTDNSMSVFTYYLIEGFKGYADRNRDSKISLDDLNTYVTGNVTKWAIENGKKQTPNLKTELAGALMFKLNNIEVADDSLEKSESVEIEKNALTLTLSSTYVTPSSEPEYDDHGMPIDLWKDIPAEERKTSLNNKKKDFTRFFFAKTIEQINPSQIICKKKDEYEIPYGKLINTSKSPFKYEFKLIISKKLQSPEVNALLGLLDEQDKIYWGSVEYLYLGHFNFDIICNIAREREYLILEFQPEDKSLSIQISPEKNFENIMVSFGNTGNYATIKISQGYKLEKEFFETMPILELINIFSEALNGGIK
ncbi:caspase family protein [Candidatus Pacearchaeota archaeon]|nr:caspase family protein [Candidatus Pacearchaeota archaeon]